MIAEHDASDDSLDDLTLPPGGLTHHLKSTGDDQHHRSEPAYLTPQGRDLRIDLLRGYFVLAMVVDHVRGPSPLYLLTGGNRFYTSAAEGFILTSGLVAGLVYHHLIERDGMGPSIRKVLIRAGSLYLLTVGLTLLFLPLSELLYLPWAQGVDLSNPIGFVVSVFTLHRTYYLVDVMLLYTVLFLISPLAFYLLASGKTWLLLGGSFLLWGLFQVFPDYVSLPWPISGNYLFELSAWQVLFFTGLALGRHHDRIPTLGKRSSRLILLLTGLATVALIVLFFVVDAPTDTMPANTAATSAASHDMRLWLQDAMFSKADLRLGRLITSAVVFTFLFLSVTVFWRQLRRALGWLLLPLGQHALYAYTAHVAIIALVSLALAPFKVAYPGPQWLNAAIQIGSVLLITLLVKWQFLAPTPSTKRLWYASPAAFAVLVLVALMAFPSHTHPGLVPPTVDPNAAQARIARAYGTPVSAASLMRVPGTPTPTPSAPATPTPQPRSAIMSDGVDRVSAYLGEIEGSFHERWFYSRQLDRDMPYYIYLPPDYGTAGRRYPVLYMLHGGGGDREEWVAYGLIDAADQEIRTNSLAPMIIVLPQGDKGYWTNNTGDGPRWGDYVIRDLVPHIDITYRTLRDRSARAIGGLSMGGWGALQLAFNHPNVFSIVGAHSPSLYPEGDDQVAFLGTGDEFATKDPLALARTQDGLGTLQIWLDAGDQDPWIDRTTALHQTLQDRGIDHLWNLYTGGHDWHYWEDHILDYLRFYGHALSHQ
jgi:enterochelin esterase-like enzyme